MDRRASWSTLSPLAAAAPGGAPAGEGREASGHPGSTGVRVPSGLLAPIGAWLAEQRPATLPAPARAAARLQLLNMIAAVHASARSAATRQVLADALPPNPGP